MAMTKCRECGNAVSSKAETCPHCGVKLRRKTSLVTKVIGGFFILVVAVAVLRPSSPTASSPVASAAPARTTSTSTAPAASSAPSPAPPAARPAQAVADTPPAAQSKWQYSTNDDSMSSGKTSYAAVTSTNQVSFDFPYKGAQNARLTLRSHPRHGKDAIVQIERGQFLCRSYEPCQVLVRFDDQKAQTFNGVGPEDNSTTTIFLQNYDRFVAGMAKAKTVRIAANIYQEGAPVFEFDVSGFDPAKYIASSK